MPRPAEFTSQLRRSTPATHQRVCALLSCLDSRVGSSCTAATVSPDEPLVPAASAASPSAAYALSEEAVLSVLRFAFPHATPPRFLVGLGVNDSVIRSADKGETWKVLTATLPESSGVTLAEEKEGHPSDEETSPCSTESSGEEEAMTRDAESRGNQMLDALLDSLPGRDQKTKQKSTDSRQSTANRAGSRRLRGGGGPFKCSQLSAFEDIVAIGGRQGRLWVSVDRGVHFTSLQHQLAPHWHGMLHPVASSTAAKSAAAALCDVQGLCVLDDHTLVVTNGYVVTRVAFRGCAATTSAGMRGNDRVDVAGVRDIFRAASLPNRSQTGGICWLGALPFRSGVRELVVSEFGRLSFSTDGGDHFLSVWHPLGNVRCCDNLSRNAARQSELPAFPSQCRVWKTLRKMEGKSSEVVQYEYAKGFQMDAPLDPETTTMLQRSHLWLPLKSLTTSDGGGEDRGSHGAAVAYRYYFVVGVGAPVLSYDYSALLCVGAVLDHGARTSLFAIADRVQYVPYTTSSPSEPLLCLTARLPPWSTHGTSGKPDERTAALGLPFLLALRGNSAGVSRSRGAGPERLQQWEPPRASTPVALLLSDGGEVLVCLQRNVVYHWRREDHTAGAGVPFDAVTPRESGVKEKHQRTSNGGLKQLDAVTAASAVSGGAEKEKGDTEKTGEETEGESSAAERVAVALARSQMQKTAESSRRMFAVPKELRVPSLRALSGF